METFRLALIGGYFLKFSSMTHPFNSESIYRKCRTPTSDDELLTTVNSHHFVEVELIFQMLQLLS